MFVILPLLYLKKIKEVLGRKKIPPTSSSVPAAKKELAWAEQFGGCSTNQLSAMPLVKACCGSCVSKYLPSFLKNTGTIGLDDVA